MPEDQTGGEEEADRGSSRPRPVHRRRAPRRSERGPGGGQRCERTPGQHDRQGDDERAGGDGGSPAEMRGHRRQDEGRGHAAERQPHLLDAHGDAALGGREDIHDALAERGIDHAPAGARHEQAEQEAEEGRRARAGEQADGAERQAAEQARPHAQSIGQAAARQREEQATEIDGRHEERDLQPAEAEAIDQARRERRDAEHPERAGAVARASAASAAASDWAVGRPDQRPVDAVSRAGGAERLTAAVAPRLETVRREGCAERRQRRDLHHAERGLHDDRRHRGGDACR